MLQLQNVSYAYQSGKIILKGVSIDVPKGYITALTGQNGAGKTTLLKLLYGALLPKVGKAVCDGTPINTQTLDEIHGKTAFISTDVWQAECKSTEWHAQLFSELYQNFDPERMEEILERFHFPEEAKSQSIETLSTGQKMQAQTALSLAKHPEYIIMDEPLANVDPVVKTDMLDMIQEAVAQGCGVIISTHLTSEIEMITDRIVTLEEGKIQYKDMQEDASEVMEDLTDTECPEIKAESNADRRTKENKNDFTGLFRWMKKENALNVRYMVALAMAAVVLVLQYFMGVGPVLSAAELFLMLSAVYEYFGKYSKIRNRESINGISTSVHFGKLLRFHRLPVKEYGKFLLRKFLPAWIVYACVLIASMILSFSPVSILYAVAWGCIPFAVAAAEIAAINRELTNENGLGWEIGSLLVHGVYHIFFLICTFGGITAVTLLIGVLLPYRLIRSGWPEDIPVVLTGSYTWLMIALVIAMALLIALLISSDDRLNIIAETIPLKNSKKSRLLFAGITAAVLLADIVCINTNYVICSGDQVTVAVWGKVREYTLEDVTACRMFDEQEELAIELTFSDGSTAQIFGTGSFSNNDLWSETYYSQYDYALELAEKLQEQGISVSLEDEDKIRNDISECDQKIRDSYEELAERIR